MSHKLIRVSKIRQIFSILRMQIHFVYTIYHDIKCKQKDYRDNVY